MGQRGLRNEPTKCLCQRYFIWKMRTELGDHMYVKCEEMDWRLILNLKRKALFMVLTMQLKESSKESETEKNYFRFLENGMKCI